MLANGPGDPAALDHLVAELRELVGALPIFGICLGHQLLCRAVGLETYKLRFGHRGANHPVKDLETGRIEITSQNHGFAVLGPGGERTIDGDRPVRWETDFGAGRADPPQPLRPHRRGAAAAARRAPARSSTTRRRGPGPHDALHLFDRFIAEIARLMPRRDDIQPDHDPRLGADRDRPGGRVRLLGRAGLQGARRGGLRGRSSSTPTRRRS